MHDLSYSNFKLTLELVCRNEWTTFRSASTGLHHALVVTWPRYFYRSSSRIGCLWLDPDTSTGLDHAMVVCDLTQVVYQCVIKICSLSRSKCRSFVLANLLQSKFKLTIILIIGAMNNIPYCFRQLYKHVHQKPFKTNKSHINVFWTCHFRLWPFESI